MENKKYWLLLSGFVSLLAGYINIVYNENYNLLWLDLPSFILTLSFPLTLIILYLEYDWAKSFSRLINGIIFIICIAPFYFILTESKDCYKKYQLKNFGVKTYGIISGYETESNKHGTSNYSIFVYECNNKKFTQRIFDKKLKYKIGDTVRLYASTKNPNVIRIIEAEIN